MNDPIERLRAALADRYEIVREIGSGGMATVYLATDVRHERQVALKVLRPELAATLGPERFLQEVRVTANLQHPHILPLFDSGEADGFLFYVMPFVEGESLRDRLAREGELPVPEAARLLRDVVDALAAAHAMGVVHRDVKPENIMLSGRHAMVTDFGVAKAVSEATGRHRLTTVGVALGTPTYMAPEQAAADTNIDHRVDVYAVGVIAYELLAGRTPFTGRTPQQMLSAHVTETPRRVGEVRASVPPGLEALVMRCLEKKPADRWQHAEEMLPLLELFATPSTGITPTGTMPTAAARPRPLSGRAKVGIAALAAFALAALWLGRGRIIPAGATADAVDPQLFAVVPFRVSGADPSLAYLREGMVDLLSVKLSGAGRTVEPRTVLDAWQRSGGGGSDPPLGTIVEMAAGLGAGRVLLGSAVGSPEQLTLSASLYETSRGRELATASVLGKADELPDVIDRLTAQIVSLEAGQAQERLATLTTTSLPALRAYLDGLAYYRRGLYQEATESLVEAVRQDSTFAVAALYMSEANGMMINRLPAAAGAGAVVRAHRDRLGPRDRAYSLVLFPDSADGRTTIERWEAAIPALEDRPEAWYHLGDIVFHVGAMFGLENFLGRSKEALSRAVALDSTYFTPLQHLIWIAEVEGDTAFVLDHMRRYLEAESSGAVADEFRFSVASLTGDSATLERLDADLESLSDETLSYLTVGPTGIWIVPSFDPERAARASEIALGRATTPAARVAARVLRYHIAMNAGRPTAAEVLLQQAASIPGQAAGADRARIHGAIFWDGDPEAAAAAASRIRRSGASDAADAYALAMWDLAQGRSEGVGPTIERLRHSGLVPDSLRAQILEARRAQLAGDPDAPTLARALDVELRRGRATNDIRAQGNLTLAALFEAQGDVPSALSATRRVMWSFDGERYATTFLRERGRLASEVGEVAEAEHAYEVYLKTRRIAEPALQPEVERIRTELADLRGRTGGRTP